MRPRDGLPFRKSAVLLVIIGAHVLLIVVFSRAGKQYLRSAQSEPETSSLLFFFELPPPEEPTPDAAPQAERSTESHPAARPDAGTAITLPAESSTPASTAIDWYAQAEELAREKSAPAPRGPRTFGEIPKSPFTRKQPTPQTPWKPQEKRAGFEGPLPYVRLGRRCILMPPFIGCAIGKLPKSKGIPREEVLDRDRDRSSVPMLDDQWTLTPRQEPR